ncbi:hypothetical protein T10_12354 [Trichinella papuae]|uniref:Uncharacterized protein n=1 Tax=Trichinella papuae TaxID=268474 RepID=A0A0V1MHL6_9BILA|nr:hypothetical protein T10_12354 [Trichinella papuae]
MLQLTAQIVESTKVTTSKSKWNYYANYPYLKYTQFVCLIEQTSRSIQLIHSVWVTFFLSPRAVSALA